MSTVRELPTGSAAALLEVADTAAALDLARWLRVADVLPDGLEIVPAARTVLVDGLTATAREALRTRLEQWVPGQVDVEPRQVVLPVVYDGPDLDVVARTWGTDRDGVIARHTGTAFTAAFCGFSPGFAYLAGLPDDLAVPRLETPRTRVPPGSVALAGVWCGVYPSASPGGWQIIGHTDVALWRLDADPPALITPGTAVRFETA